MFRRPRLRELEPARRALADGRYDAAFSLLENAARRPVGRAAQAEYLLHLAALFALYGEDERESGEWVLTEAVMADPGLSEHPLYVALYWTFEAMREGASREGRRELRAVVGKGDPVAEYHAADALVRMGGEKAAIRILERSDDLPAYLEWRRWSLLGQAYERLARWDAAAPAFRRAVEAALPSERDPERLSLAGSLLELGEVEEAATVLAEVNERYLLPTELADKHYLEGRTEFERGNPNRALACYLASREVDEAAPFDVLFATGQCLVELGRAAEAADAFTDALFDAPAEQRSVTQHERALALVDAERYDEAEAAFTAVLGDPHYDHRAEAYADYADARLRTGDLDTAERLATQAVELGAVGPASLTLATVALEYYRLDEAVEHLEQAASSGPEGGPIWIASQQMLADAFAQRGPEFAARALHHAEAALEHTPLGDEWRVVLEQVVADARSELGGRRRVLN